MIHPAKDFRTQVFSKGFHGAKDTGVRICHIPSGTCADGKTRDEAERNLAESMQRFGWRVDIYPVAGSYWLRSDYPAYRV